MFKGVITPDDARWILPYKKQAISHADISGAAATTDVIDSLAANRPPAKALILYAGCWVEEAFTFDGDATDLALDVGETGVNTDEYIDNLDLEAADLGWNFTTADGAFASVVKNTSYPWSALFTVSGGSTPFIDDVDAGDITIWFWYAGLPESGR
jgi:hypothetical protein